MQTTGGGTQEHRRAGRVRFQLDGEEAEITLRAYDADWSCPLPSGENWLRVPLRAGERNFTGETA